MSALRDAILALDDPVAVVLGVLEHVQRRIVNHGIEALSPAELTLFSLYDLICEVDNGGFIQYFQNSSGDLSGDALAALHRIGAPVTAGILERVIARLGPQATSVDRNTRWAAIEALVEADWDAFEEDNDAFYAYPEPLWELIAAHCRAHPEQLHIESDDAPDSVEP